MLILKQMVLLTKDTSTRGRQTWEHEDKKLQVKIVRRPGRGLMLGHRGNDGDVVLGVRGIQQ